MSVQVEFDTTAVGDRLKARLARVQAVLDIQVLKDSNLHIPQSNERDLMRSGKVVEGGGAIVWDKEYARRQYYLDENVAEPAKIKYTTPGTRYKWFEWAKAEKLKQWEALANREYNK